MSDYFRKIEKQVQKLPKKLYKSIKVRIIFNVGTFTVQALVVQCDKILDSIMAELLS